MYVSRMGARHGFDELLLGDSCYQSQTRMVQCLERVFGRADLALPRKVDERSKGCYGATEARMLILPAFAASGS